jgi:TPR repeat protein
MFEAARARAEQNVLAAALHGRGRVHRYRQHYVEAIADFREAQRLGHEHAGTWLWWATDGLGGQRSKQGKLIGGLLLTWTNLLDLSPEVRKTIESTELRSNVTFAFTLGQLVADIASRVHLSNATDCDQLASHPSDPLRVAPGVSFDSLDAARALTACDAALAAHPGEARLFYLRGRAHTRAGRLANAKKDTNTALVSFAAAITDLQTAMTRGYPMAFNNVASAYRDGEGVTKDQAKAAALSVEFLNRVIHCCTVPVARHLLAEEAKHKAADVRRVARELLLWAAALSSEPARALLAELAANDSLAYGPYCLTSDLHRLAAVAPQLNAPHVAGGAMRVQSEEAPSALPLSGLKPRSAVRLLVGVDRPCRSRLQAAQKSKLPRGCPDRTAVKPEVDGLPG